MAKLKLDKESLQGFFFNHTEKIVLAVVLLLLALFIWSGSSLEGIGAQNPAELASKVDAVAKKIENPTWDNIKENYPLSLDHVARKQVGDAVTSESFYRLETPLSPPGTSPNTPRQDPEIFAVTDVEATVVIGALAFKARKDWTDPFAELANMEQKKIEAPKKKKKKKKRASMYGEDMVDMYSGEGGEDEAMSAMSEMMSAMGGMEGMGGMSTGPSVRAEADKFWGYRPTSLSTPSGPAVIGRFFPTVSVKALVPYQQQWDEFERVFADAAGYQSARDIPRYLSFRAERAEVPDDPNAPLNWTLITNTSREISLIPQLAFDGYPGEIADSKYLLPGVLTMPVPPVMMRDLRELALHSKVPMQEEVKAATVVDRVAPAVVDINELGSTPDIDTLPAVPAARLPGAGRMGSGMYGRGSGAMYGAGMDGSGGGMEDMYGDEGMGMGMGGYGGGMGGMSSQLVLGPQAEFLMVRFFDHFVKPGKKYVYRIQVVLEDPNHPQNPLAQPQDRNLADTARVRLAKVAADEAKETAARKTPVRLYTLLSAWSEPTAPISVDLPSETYAGGVAQPRRLDILRSSEPNILKKSGYSVPADGEPTAEVMNLAWNPKYAIDLPGIVTAPRGAYLSKAIQADVIDPVTLNFKVIPDHQLSSGELVVDLRGGEVLEAKVGDAPPLLTPGEVALIDASGNFIVRNELDDWKIFDKYAPPPPIVVEATPAPSEEYGDEMMEYGGGSGRMERE